MGNADTILKYSKKIESLLGELGAEGRGMHSKVSSIEQYLDENFVKRIRFIATVRNKTFHEDGYEVEDMPYFIETSENIIQELESIYETNSVNTTSTHTQFSLPNKLFAAFVILLTVYNLSTIPESTHQVKKYTALKRGDNNLQVKKLQKALKEKGFYKGKIDGIFGPKLKKSLQEFQKKEKIKADGIAGEKTLKILEQTNNADLN